MKEKVFIILFLFFALTLFSVVVPYSEKPIKTDENHFSNFVRIDPDDKQPIPLKTDAWIWHDDKNIYVLWEAEIDKDFEKGRFAARDVWTDCDYLRVQLITDIKNYYAYLFASFPLDNKYDGIRKSDLNMDRSWDSNYSYKNTINDTLWQSLVKIPLADLRFYGKSPYKWKIILTRYFQKNDEYYSCPYGTTDMGKDYFRKAEDIVINEKLKGSKNYKITPYFVKKYDLIEKTESFDPENIGLDFSYNPSTSTKMKLSFNPDYSDVPMDSEMDNFNSKYAPYLPENRYFFIEDLDVFGVGNDIFYSRNILQPQYAIKLTGNKEKFSYGVLSLKDKKITENGVITNNDDMYNMIAIRPKTDNFSMQITAINRINKNLENEVLHLNPNWEFIKNHTLATSLTLSYNSKNIDKKGYTFSGGYFGKINKDLTVSMVGSYCSKDYFIQTGRVNDNNYNTFNGSLYYHKDFNKKALQNLAFNLSFRSTHYNDTNYLMFEYIGLYSSVSFKQKFAHGFYIQKSREDYKDVLYKLWYANYNFNIWRYKFLNFKLMINYSRRIVYMLNDSYINRNSSIGFWGNITSNVSYSLSLQNIKYFYVPKTPYFDDEYNLVNGDITINLSNKISLKNGLRYNSYNTGHIGFFSNFRYEFRKNSNIYLGYKTTQDENQGKYIPNFRQAYLKVGYNF